MKLTICRTSKKETVTIPAPLIKVTGLDEEVALECRAEPGMMIITPAIMTAMDLIRAIDASHKIWLELITKLASACETCDECGMCEAIDPFEAVTIPTHILEEAGLAPHTKLTAVVDRDGDIVVEPAAYECDLTDVPEHVLDALKYAGVCLLELEDWLAKDYVVYESVISRVQQEAAPGGKEQE